MKYSKILLVLSLFTALITDSCKKSFLNKGIPQDALTTTTFYQTPAELRMATAFLYGQPWFDYNFPFAYEIGEVQSDNIITYTWNSGPTAFLNFAVPSNSSDTKYGWSSLFNVIANSNTTIININNQTPASLGAAKTQALGEAHFMRGIAYFQLVQIFGPVPIIEDNSKVAFNPNLNANIVKDVYTFIINDLNYAVANLPLTDDPGRVTKWSAEGLLSKVYLTRAGITGTRVQSDLDSARNKALDVAANSGLNLMPNYADIFLSKNNNNPECLFGLQWSVDPSSPYGNNDQRQVQIEGDASIDNVGGGGWGGYRVSADLAKLFSSSDLRRKPTFMQDGDTYPELITAPNPNGYSMTDTTSLYVKKYVIGGPLANNGANITPQHSDIPTYLLRLSDVYLVLAEATLGTNTSTTDANALLYFNKVRTRAGLPAATSLDFKTIFNERRLELAGEDQFWFDIKRWHDYNSSAALAFVLGQHRNMASYSKGDTQYNEVLPVVTGVQPQSWTLGYPAADLTSDPKLLQPPVPYY